MIKSFLELRRNLNRKWGILVKDKRFLIALLFGTFLLFFGESVVCRAAEYNDQMFKVVSVGDLILDYIPTVDVGFFYTWGMVVMMIVITFYTVFFRPELAPWVLKTYGLFALVRAGFILLTHLGPPDGLISFDSLEVSKNVVFEKFFYMNDLFFSGHVGNLFLGYLLFKHYKFRWFCLVGSILMGGAVLLMHIHYSIDVFGAYFITYGIYAFSNKVFHRFNERFKNLIFVSEEERKA
jgi:membrane-associated phospholipid phosphatase